MPRKHPPRILATCGCLFHRHPVISVNTQRFKRLHQPGFLRGTQSRRHQSRLPRMTVGMLVHSEIADVHEVVGKARASTIVAARANPLEGVRPAGGQNIGGPV